MRVERGTSRPWTPFTGPAVGAWVVLRFSVAAPARASGPTLGLDRPAGSRDPVATDLAASDPGGAWLRLVWGRGRTRRACRSSWQRSGAAAATGSWRRSRRVRRGRRPRTARGDAMVRALWASSSARFSTASRPWLSAPGGCDRGVPCVPRCRLPIGVLARAARAIANSGSLGRWGSAIDGRGDRVGQRTWLLRGASGTVVLRGRLSCQDRAPVLRPAYPRPVHRNARPAGLRPRRARQKPRRQSSD
jgi:hypothetical protein